MEAGSSVRRILNEFDYKVFFINMYLSLFYRIDLTRNLLNTKLETNIIFNKSNRNCNWQEKLKTFYRHITNCYSILNCDEP